MITKNYDCSLYIIPTPILLKSEKHMFLNSKNSKQSYWEINVFLESIPELSQFSLNRMIELH